MPFLLALGDACAPAAVAAAREALAAAAAPFFVGGVPSEKLRFALATDADEAVASVRKFIKVAPKDGAVQYVIVNVPAQGIAVLGGAPGAADVAAFAARFAAGEVELTDI